MGHSVYKIFLFVAGAQVNWNVFGYEIHEPKKFIVETTKTVRGQVLIDTIARYADNLNVAYDKVSASKEDVVDGGWTTDGLRHFASRTIFHAIFTTVFGRTEHVFNPDMVFANFETFHKCVSLLTHSIIQLVVSVKQTKTGHLYSASILISKAFRMARVNEGSHSFTCRPRVWNDP